MPKLIKNWEELFALPPNDKYKIVQDKDGYPCGWIVPIEETPKTEGKDFFKHHIYLSTHTFYGSTYKYSTKKLQEYGFDVEINNWDKEVHNDSK